MDGGRATAGTRGRRRVWPAAAGVAVAGVVAGLGLFQPWKLWVDEAVDEAPPIVAAPAVPVAPPGSSGAALPPGGPVVLAQGTFVRHDRHRAGRAGGGRVAVRPLMNSARRSP